MFLQNRPKFEFLENRLCLAVTGSVSSGDLVSGVGADSAVEIVAVGEGDIRVTDNGVVVEDETTLQGISDDIQINQIDHETDIKSTKVMVADDLAVQTVDKVYADLGDTELRPDEQADHHSGCGGDREFGELWLNGRRLGFFFRESQR
jgi:hypothetical protein